MKVTKEKTNIVVRWKQLAKYTVAATSMLAIGAIAQPNVTFEVVLEIAESLGVFDFSIHPELEVQEKEETQSTIKSARLMFQAQMATEPQSRDAHAKAHACLAAQVQILDSIPSDLKVGVFAHNPNEPYDAIIRFSNGAGTTQSDQNPDGRGMAIKLLNVDSNKMNLLKTGHTQDFMLVNNEKFFVGSIKDYARMNEIKNTDRGINRFFLEKAITEAISDANVNIDPTEIPYSDLEKIEAILLTQPIKQNELISALDAIAPGKSGVLAPVLFQKLQAMKAGLAPLELKNAMEILTKNSVSMANAPFFSMTSFLLKSSISTDKDLAVKYIARPANCTTHEDASDFKTSERTPLPQSENKFREDLTARLKTQGICYNFYLQVLDTGAANKKSLVEDPRLTYNTKPILVARILIKKQDLNSYSRNFCENLSFNPWQAFPEHQPLGALNRARKVAVTTSSIRRHLFNNTQRKEPTSIHELISE